VFYTIKCISRPIKVIDFKKMHGETLKLKFCCVLTYPPYINFDIVIAHDGDEPSKDYDFSFGNSMSE